MPALALARVRLEAAIVSSYLVHETDPTVLERFASFGPISEYRIAAKVQADPLLAPHTTALDLGELRKAAASVEVSFNPGFDVVDGKFAPKWTTLDLASMAARRDRLSSQGGHLTKVFPLSSLYISIYGAASSVVHTDGSVVASPFFGEIAGTGGQTIGAADYWALALPPFVATCDFIQCYEALRVAGIEADAAFLKIASSLGGT